MYEELLKALRCCADDNIPCKSCPRCAQCTKDMNMNSLFPEAADAIEDLEFACNRYEKDYKALCAYLPKWIPVAERLPEDTYPVLVTYLGYNDKLPKSDMVAMYDDGDWYWYDDESKCKVAITHWMPLPPPPKEENE